MPVNRVSSRMGTPSTNGAPKKSKKKFDILNHFYDDGYAAHLNGAAFKIYMYLWKLVHSARLDRIASRDEIMKACGIGSNSTYKKAVDELVDTGLVIFERGYNIIGSRKFTLVDISENP